MTITKQANVQQALRTGIKMLTSEHINTPNSMNEDLTTLKHILVGVLNGTFDLVQGETSDDLHEDSR